MQPSTFIDYHRLPWACEHLDIGHCVLTCEVSIINGLPISTDK